MDAIKRSLAGFGNPQNGGADPERNVASSHPILRLYQQVRSRMNPEAAVVGGVSATAMRSLFYPVERASTLRFLGRATSNREAWKQVRAAPYRGFRPQFLAAIGGSWAYYGVGFAFVDRDKPVASSLLVAGPITAILEQVSAKRTALYYRADSELSLISLKGRVRVQSVMLVRHLAANGPTFALGLVAQQALEKELPKEWCWLGGLLGGAFAVKVTHILFYDRLVALSVLTSVHPEEPVWKTCRTLIQGGSASAGDGAKLATLLERVKAGGILRGRGRMAILAGGLACESLWRNLVQDQQ